MILEQNGTLVNTSSKIETYLPFIEPSLTKVNRFAVTPAVLSNQDQNSTTLPTPASQSISADYRVKIIKIIKK